MSDYDFCSSRHVEIFAEKDPDATVDYCFKWEPWLDGDVIETSVFLLPDGLTQASSSFTNTKATIFVSGGTSGNTYRITNRITTVGNRTQDKTIYIRICDQ